VAVVWEKENGNEVVMLGVGVREGARLKFAEEEDASAGFAQVRLVDKLTVDGSAMRVIYYGGVVVKSYEIQKKGPPSRQRFYDQYRNRVEVTVFFLTYSTATPGVHKKELALSNEVLKIGLLFGLSKAAAEHNNIDTLCMLGRGQRVPHDCKGGGGGG
jgi:hypothetical protein